MFQLKPGIREGRGVKLQHVESQRKRRMWPRRRDRELSVITWSREGKVCWIWQEREFCRYLSTAEPASRHSLRLPCSLKVLAFSFGVPKHCMSWFPSHFIHHFSVSSDVPCSPTQPVNSVVSWDLLYLRHIPKVLLQSTYILSTLTRFHHSVRL